MSAEDFSHCDVWTRVYKGIFVKIHRHKLDKNKDVWCYYLSFNKDRLKNDVFNKITAGIKETKYFSCNYQESPLANLNWHHGCTFGKLIRDENAELHVMELGCDYNHYWDQGNIYTFEDIEQDAYLTVDDFFKHYPNSLKS